MMIVGTLMQRFGLPSLLGLAISVRAAEGDAEFFEKRIRPVLVEQCYECHSAGGKSVKGGLKLDSRESLLAGGDTGPALVPGQPGKSLLLNAISHRDKELTMPPKKPRLPDAVLADFERWIGAGAIWAGPATVAVATPAAFDLEERKRKLPWIWESPVRPSIPAVRRSGWAANPMDAFVLHRLEQEGFQPAEPAEPEVWLRRVHFALVGLPPSVAVLEAFLRNPSPESRQQLVDQLLGSAHFGERWARHWLDLTRYAESRGHEGDYVIPNAYEYRDYVIRALNADLPYDAFVREHVAGDVMTAPRRHPEAGFNESILGTGWAFLGEEIHAPVDTRLDETERIDNRIDVLSKTFLGLTVSCARCHDHKFDAITQRDYYALAGFFLSSGQRLARFETMESERTAARALAALRGQWQTQLAQRFSEAQHATAGRIQPLLLAAAEVARARTNGLPASGKPVKGADLTGPESTLLARLAEERSLERTVLAQWTAALLNAVSNRSDLLHPFASLVFSRPLPTGLPPLPLYAPVALPEAARVILDFQALPPRGWVADGVGFGLGPVPPGEIRLTQGFSNAPPLIRVATRAAAMADGDWFQMGFRPGVEREPAIYGGWVRDGAMVRSPKIELQSGKLHYLVRGSGRVFAAVDSQRLVTGPLHTALAREWGDNENWHWVSQNLSEYSGHRVALEFSPGNGFETAVALVIESEKTPEDPWTPVRFLSQRLSGRSVSNTIPLAVAASVYQEVLVDALQALPGSGPTPEQLELADWLARRPELCSGDAGRWPEPLAAPMKQYLAQRDELLRGIRWKSRVAPAMWDAEGVDEYLLVRGKHHSTKGTVPRRFLEAISGPQPLAVSAGSGRRELAALMTDPQNPLLARVMVNRVWHHLFGRGIVPSVDNFGWLGQRPSHPELLDYLAWSFVHEDHWSVKKLIRRMILSSTYAQSSHPVAPEVEARDPENVLLHRMNLKRLEGEVIRDAILTLSGRLDLRMYGVSVPLHESQFMEARGLRSERGPLDGEGRRSLYIAARRNFLPMMMTAFDLPIPFTTVGRRNVSNVPGQMLFLMNDPFVHQQAEVWARRVEKDGAPRSEDARIQQLFLSAFSRSPSTREIEVCRETLQQARTLGVGADSEKNAWTELCHALLGTKEFIFVR